MVIIKKYLKLLVFFFCLLLFDFNELDSNSDKVLIYDKNYNDSQYNIIHFKNLNSYFLNTFIDDYDIEILSYTIDDKKYYSRDIDELIDNYTANMSEEEKIYYKINGIKIDAIGVMCDVKFIEKMIDLNLLY